MKHLSLLLLFLLFLGLTTFSTAQEIVLDYNQAVRGLQVTSAKQYGQDWYFIVNDGYYNAGVIKADANLGASSFFRRLDVPAAEDDFTFIGNDVYLFREESGCKSIIKYDPSNSSTLLKKYSAGVFTKIVEGSPFIIYEHMDLTWKRTHHRIDPSGHYEFEGELPANYQLLDKLSSNLGTVVIFDGPLGFKGFHYVGGQLVKEVSLDFPFNGQVIKSWLVDEYLVAQISGEIYFWKWDNIENDFALHFKESTFAEHAQYYFNPAANHFYLYEDQGAGKMTVDWFDLTTKTKKRIENIEGNKMVGAWTDKFFTSYASNNYYTSDGSSENIGWLDSEAYESITADNYLLVTINDNQLGTEIARIDLTTGQLINFYDLNPGLPNGVVNFSSVISNYFFTDNKIYLFSDNGTVGNNLFEYNLTNHFLQPLDPLGTCNKGSDYDFFIIEEAFYALSVKRAGTGWQSSFWAYDYEGDEANEVFSVNEELQLVGKAGEKVICTTSENLYKFNGPSGIEKLISAVDLDADVLNIRQAEVIGDYIYFIHREGNKDFICRYNLTSEELIKIDPQVNSFSITAMHKTGDRILFACDNFNLDEIRAWHIDAPAPLTLLDLNTTTFALNRIYPHQAGNKLYYIIKNEDNEFWELWHWSNANLELEKLTNFPEGLYINSPDFFVGHEGSIYGKGAGSAPGIPLESIWKYDAVKNEISIPNAWQSHLLKEIKAITSYNEEDYVIIKKTSGDNYVLAKVDEEDFDILHHFPEYYYALEPLGSFGADLLFGFKQTDAIGGLFRINVATLEFEKMNFSQLNPQDFYVTDKVKKYRDQIHVVAYESCTDEEWWRFNIADYPTAVKAASSANDQFTLFPNPAHAQFSIALNASAPIEELTIYSATGKLLRHETRLGAKRDFSTAGLVPGLYLVNIKTGGAEFTERLVVL